MPGSGPRGRLAIPAMPVAAKRRQMLNGNVNLFGYGRNKAHGADEAHPWSCHAGSTCHLGPGLEGLGPYGSILMGGEVIAAQVEEQLCSLLRS